MSDEAKTDRQPNWQPEQMETDKGESAADLRQTGAAQSLGAMKSGPEPEKLLGIAGGFRVMAAQVLRHCNPTDEHRRLRIERT